ncbi:MAG: nucleoside triphosphate pyrophosphohydrolase [Treponema sp.]|jgi:tetrapyrrole methylase family protein/MazG family protein|nr:nucleoside triphosphate pyrophosphohydrolase [Treponema sp.]
MDYTQTTSHACTVSGDDEQSASFSSRPADTPGETFNRLYGIVKKLRGEGGCPWDREQSPISLRGDLVEECYECIEAIDEQNPVHIKEELGDLFLLVTMISYIHQQEGQFSVSEVLKDISEKLIRRHPHVFGGIRTDNKKGTINSAKVLDNWARIKVEQEGRKPKDSVLDEVSRALPPLDRAWKLQKKAAKKGFDWPNYSGALEKLKEELAEVEAAAPECFSKQSGGQSVQLEEELGDLLFSAVNLCRFFNVVPSLALQRTNVKFTARFAHVEKKMKECGAVMETANLELMDRFWNEAKAHK